MCYDDHARPPLPPIRGGAADAGALTLTSADGTLVGAYGARAARSGGPGIVVLPDVRSLHPFFEELALRFAEAGVHAVAIDYFARTAEPWPRGPNFDFGPHVALTRHATLNADTGAAVAHLRSASGGAAERVYTVGFCFGGRISSLQAAAGHGLAGVITFYGSPVGEHRAGIPAPVDVAPQFECPVLALYGGDDPGIPPDEVAAYDRALDAAGIERRTVVYPDAPHSFFDRTAAEHASASEDAWREVLGFIGVE
ncbi:MAG: dienelactone hydrolase family protein [Chloroflexota bacterium]